MTGKVELIVTADTRAAAAALGNIDTAAKTLIQSVDGLANHAAALHDKLAGMGRGGVEALDALAKKSQASALGLQAQAAAWAGVAANAQTAEAKLAAVGHSMTAAQRAGEAESRAVLAQLSAQAVAASQSAQLYDKLGTNSSRAMESLSRMGQSGSASLADMEANARAAQQMQSYTASIDRAKQSLGALGNAGVAELRRIEQSARASATGYLAQATALEKVAATSGSAEAKQRALASAAHAAGQAMEAEARATAAAAAAQDLLNSKARAGALGRMADALPGAVQSGSTRLAGMASGAVLGGIAGVAAVAGVASSVDAVQSIADAKVGLDAMKKSMEAVTGSAQQAGQEFAYEEQVAERLGLKLIGVGQGYAGVTAASKGTALEGEKTRQIFESVSAAGGALGRTSDEVNGMLLALAQMMSKGVHAEELVHQLGDRLPGAVQIMARAMGVGTDQLYKMMEAGLSAEEALPRFGAELAKTYASARFDGMVNNINRLDNAWLHFKDNILSSGTLGSIISGITGALSSFNERSAILAVGDSRQALSINRRSLQSKLDKGGLSNAEDAYIRSQLDSIDKRMAAAKDVTDEQLKAVEDIWAKELAAAKGAPRENAAIKQMSAASAIRQEVAKESQDFWQRNPVYIKDTVKTPDVLQPSSPGLSANFSPLNKDEQKALAEEAQKQAVFDAKQTHNIEALTQARARQLMVEKGYRQEVAQSIAQGEVGRESEKQQAAAIGKTTKELENRREAGAKLIAGLQAEIQENRLSNQESEVERAVRLNVAKGARDQAAAIEALTRQEYAEKQVHEYLVKSLAMEEKSRQALAGLRIGTGENVRLATLAESMRLQGAANDEISRQIELERALGQVHLETAAKAQEAQRLAQAALAGLTDGNQIDQVKSRLAADLAQFKAEEQAALVLVAQDDEAKKRLAALTDTSSDSLSQYATQAARNMQSAFADFLFDPFDKGAKGMLESFGQTVRRMAAEAASAKIMEGLFGKGMDFAGGLVGPMLKSAGSAVAGLFGFANGGIMTDSGPLPLHYYASGGIANSPQLAVFGEGRLPEANIPLPDGRTVPVTLKAPLPTGTAKILPFPVPQPLALRGDAAGVTVQIIDQRQSGARPEVTQSRGPDGRTQIKIMIREELRDAFNSGYMDKPMRQNYAIRRSPGVGG